MLEKLPEGLGHALINQRAGMEQVLINRITLVRELPRFGAASGMFADGAAIPSLYTADGAGLSPPLTWRGAPEDAESVALIVEDADSPTPHPLVHAIVVNLAGEFGFLAEGALDSPEHKGLGYSEGRNSFFQQAWLPPDPPPGHGTHRYVFQFFALRAGHVFSRVPGRDQFTDIILERAIAAGVLIGTYERVLREPARQAEFEPEAAEPPAIAAEQAT